MIYELLIPALVFVLVVGVGGILLAVRVSRRKPLQDRLQGLDGRKPAAGIPTRRSPLLRGLDRLGSFVSLGRFSPRLREELARAGYHGRAAAAVYLGAKVLLFAVGLIVLIMMLLPLRVSLVAKVLIVVVGAVGMFFLPNLAMYSHRRKRARKIRHHLPDALDLLDICVCSGMGLDMAWNVVAEEMRRVSTPLADEMALTNLEIHLGASRAAAMRHMGERTRAEEISSLVTVLVQSDKFGTSIVEALQAFADSMREERSLLAQESAEKAAVKLLFPMVLFIFPAVLIVLAGPAGIRLAEMLGGE
ncbi:MAG: type II secretion system F family protein [Methyloceanibacter sp.]